jgi:hypothetical protein
MHPHLTSYNRLRSKAIGMASCGVSRLLGYLGSLGTLNDIHGHHCRDVSALLSDDCDLLFVIGAANDVGEVFPSFARRNPSHFRIVQEVQCLQNVRYLFLYNLYKM